jgi:hypothetical protein
MNDIRKESISRNKVNGCMDSRREGLNMHLDDSPFMIEDLKLICGLKITAAVTSYPGPTDTP